MKGDEIDLLIEQHRGCMVLLFIVFAMVFGLGGGLLGYLGAKAITAIWGGK